MRICFSLACGLAAVWPAAGVEQPARSIRTVVRPDQSGRLVRAVVVSPRAVRPSVVAAREVKPAEPAAAEPSESPAGNVQEAIDQIARKHSVSPLLVHSVIQVESNYNPYAVSPKGALGIMQLVPATARRFGVSNVFNPAQNIEGGVKYLKYLMDFFKGDPKLALAAYNAGEAAVVRHGGVPPFPETHNYLNQVARRLAEARAKEKQPPLAIKPKPPEPAGEFNSIQVVTGPDGKISYQTRKPL